MKVSWKDEWKALAAILAAFLICFYLPVGQPRFNNAVLEALHLVKWYAQEHILLCLVPAFFIAGAIGVFISQQSVMKYLGAGANKVLSYGVASVSGSVLAVCSCTVLPLFGGIYRMGAGLGPACAFLYSGPAINVLAIVLTARVLGMELGIARAVGAVLFSIVIGLLMHFVYRKEESEKIQAQAALPEPEVKRPLWQNAVFFAVMILILIFANWGKPAEDHGLWFDIYSAKWLTTALCGFVFSLILGFWFKLHWIKVTLAAATVFTSGLLFPNQPLIPFTLASIGLSFITSTDDGECGEWFSQSYGFAKQILPLLFWGVLIAGLLFGRPGGEGIMPSEWVARAVGGNSLAANLFASVAGVFMYFATLTEVPILEGLIRNGMGKGPALALLLAGPALSLPSMLVLRSIMGTQKTIVFVSLVVVMATFTGLLFGYFVG
jgi:hypothetical protein